MSFLKRIHFETYFGGVLLIPGIIILGIWGHKYFSGEAIYSWIIGLGVILTLIGGLFFSSGIRKGLKDDPNIRVPNYD